MKTGSEQKTDMNKTTKIIRGSVLADADRFIPDIRGAVLKKPKNKQ